MANVAVDDAGVIDVEAFVGCGPTVIGAADGSIVSWLGLAIAFLGGSGASDVDSDDTVVEGRGSVTATTSF